MTETMQCWRCLRYRGSLLCDAFPKGIPQGILEGNIDHSKAYAGDKGLTYKPMLEDMYKSEMGYDFTKEIAEKDEVKYERVKEALIEMGYKESDFLDGGPLYGWSTNELIDLAKRKGD